MSDVVTGEAVVVEVRVAQLPSRALALLIDLAAQTALLIGVNYLLANAAQIADPALDTALQILMTVIIFVGYPVLFETLTRGRSLGKLALGLRVVADDGGPERFRQALFRGLASVPEIWLFGGAPALISSLWSRRGKRLGDLFAGTIVISTRAPRTPPPPPMPPELAEWAGGLELSQLPDEVANTARQYLFRMHQLSPAVRQDMGARVAGQVAAYVSPPPPPNVPHAAYLAAVLAERRRRAEIRLAARNGTPAYPFASPPGSRPPLGTPQKTPQETPQRTPEPVPPRPVSAPPSGEAGPTPGGFVPPS
ncbi:RDD family protein [Thermopolyspora sp. NPDC052614]|uniref:RDD family protein n=1 Tax=Thermopolyspora sp. NPDC052614 TaxID=3155682 RepID=UPI00342841A2